MPRQELLGPEKPSNAAVLDTIPATIKSSVPSKVLTFVGVETGRTKIGAKDAFLEMLAGEPIVPPPPMGSNLPVA
jgi:hypothetical protein